MLHHKALVSVISVVVLLVATTSPTVLAAPQVQHDIVYTCFNLQPEFRNCDREISQRCFNLTPKLLHCDFQDLQASIEITNLGEQLENTVDIHNAKQIIIRGEICSNVQFTNSHVELKDSSACPVKLKFISNTKVDKLPENAQQISIANAEIEELVSQTLRTADVNDAQIKLLSITSPYLKEFTAHNTKISKLKQVNLPEGSVVTFSSSGLIKAQNDSPFSFNGGVIKLEQDTRIVSLKTLKFEVTTVPNNAETKPMLGSWVEEEKITPKYLHGLEVAVGILSVAVTVLILIKFVEFLRGYKKHPDHERFMGYDCQSCNCIHDLSDNPSDVESNGT